MSTVVKTIQRSLGKAIRLHQMISEGDRILIGVSGGKDSLSLLTLLLERQRYVEPKFELIAGTIDGGFPGNTTENIVILEKHFKQLDIEYHIVSKSIAEKALDPKATKNPCFICSHHRRHAIYTLAHKLKCNKIAYAHHKDDIIETLLLNIMYSRCIDAMYPVQEVFSGNMYIIRPLAYTDESLIRRYAVIKELPVWNKICPADGHTKREKVKKMIRSMEIGEKNINIRENIFNAMNHVHILAASPVGGPRHRKNPY